MMDFFEQYSCRSRMPCAKLIMPPLQHSPYEKLARRSLEDDPHFLIRITDKAQHIEVLGVEDVFSRQRALLISKTTLVSSKLRKYLLRHKLLKAPC
jgi:hypothetical protein